MKPAIYDINTNTFMNDTETVSTGAVIGYVIVDYIHSGTVYTIKTHTCTKMPNYSACLKPLN